MKPDPLPIDAALPDLLAALRSSRMAVLQAPPGAGKTTRVPLAMLEDGAIAGRILMLEPRRVAARAAAERMAATLGEAAGETVGYRFRGATRISKATRIEVVTEGILTRLIQADPSLDGIGAVLFDEFHERSLQSDLGLALVLETREALRPDLALLVMSATLEAAPVAALMGDAPVITSEGRSFPVETRWLDKPWARPDDRRGAFERAFAGLVATAYDETEGAVLGFLPGAGEIERVAPLLATLEGANVIPLYGALPFKAQLAALRPSEDGRRHVVLATSIAETSLTIPDIRVVVDGGRTRRPAFDPTNGMTRLETTRVSRAEATQRAGRAGRVAPGSCYRLWTRGEEGGLSPFPPVEIENNDLMSLALDLAQWGARDPSDLAFLTPPPGPALAEARALLQGFGALDGAHGLTPHGAALAKRPVHPRLAHMLMEAERIGMAATARALAVLIEAGGRQRRDAGADLSQTVRDLVAGRGPLAKTLTADMARLGTAPDRGDMEPGAILSLAFPDRIGRQRESGARRYILSGGSGAVLDQGDPLEGETWLVAADLDGDRREARIRGALPMSEAALFAHHGDRIETGPVCTWDGQAEKVVAEEQERLGAIILKRRPAKPEASALRAAMLDGIRALGLEALPWTPAARRLQGRAAWGRAHGADVPDLSDKALAEDLSEWLPEALGTKRSDLARMDLLAALEARIGWAGKQALDQVAPKVFVAPTGTRVAIDYGGEVPKASIRLQELLGQTVHPSVGRDRVPLLLELLSPGQKPIQTTADLPGFWRSSYADVRKDMRGRYPKHAWPEDPEKAAPTRRTKARG